MIRVSILLFSVVALVSTGCCGPALVGGCSDCDGVGFAQTVPMGPLDNLRQMKRNLICGGGCGETYIGEWTSTPPDCNDPCCGNQWVGGAVAARPFCGWQPGMLLGSLAGQRFCDGCGQPGSSCGCGGGVVDSGCSSCGGGEVIGGGGFSSGGCSTCQLGHGATGLAQTQHAGHVQQTARMPRLQTQQRMPMQRTTNQVVRNNIQTGAPIQTGVSRTASARSTASRSGIPNAETARLKAQLREARAIEAELESRINSIRR